MKFKGKILSKRGHWEWALHSVHTPEDAQALLSAAEECWPESYREVVGYMLGEIKGPQTAMDLAKMLGVEHPVTGMVFGDLELCRRKGIEMGRRVASGEAPPRWLVRVLQIPR